MTEYFIAQRHQGEMRKRVTFFCNIFWFEESICLKGGLANDKIPDNR